jgi:antitoxin (DNA-binding transcriptional repressor) of toxin-antitoxin stability system
VDRVERGEEVVIIRHGKPVAHLVSNTGRLDPNQAHAAFQRIRERARVLHENARSGKAPRGKG